MSLYTFATTNLTTTDDRNRRPAIDTWQVVRTVAFLAVAFIALVCVARRGHDIAPDTSPSQVTAS